MAQVFGFLTVLQRSFWREPASVLWTFLFPVLMLLMLGTIYARGPASFATIAVENRDAGAHGRWIEAQIEAAGWGARAGASADAVVTISPALSRRLDTGAGADLVVRHHSHDGARQLAIHGLLSAVVLDFNQQQLGIARGLQLRAPKRLALQSPTGSYAEFLVYGLVGLNVLSMSLFGVGVGSAWFREEGVFARLWLTEASPGSYLAAHLMHLAILLALSTGLLLTAGRLLFGVSLPRVDAFAVTMVAGAFALVPIGFAVAARTPTPRVAQMWANALYFPLMFLSGVYFRPELIAEGVGSWTAHLPLAPFLEALRASRDGTPLSALGGELGVLAGWGAAGCLLARGVFRWNE